GSASGFAGTEDAIERALRSELDPQSSRSARGEKFQRVIHSVRLVTGVRETREHRDYSSFASPGWANALQCYVPIAYETFAARHLDEGDTAQPAVSSDPGPLPRKHASVPP